MLMLQVLLSSTYLTFNAVNELPGAFVPKILHLLVQTYNSAPLLPLSPVMYIDTINKR